jgi:GNAT superfamily N-acetyltransferase
VIREASRDDVPALVAAYDWLFAPPGWRPPVWDEQLAADRLGRLIDAADRTMLVAEHGGAIVGICSVALDVESVRYGQRAWVEDLAVDPEHRSAGHGKALLDAAKTWGREHGATHLELDSGEARADAHRFYERERPDYRSVQFGWGL